MYKFVIVDDDKLVRERILSAIPADELGLQFCGDAGDGISALELFDRYHPQIVIMDINIPLINGIDVAKQMLEDDKDVNIVIITGYGTVEFAREAVRNGMVDFLLKPVNFQELKAVLTKIITKLQEKHTTALEQQRMERLLEKGMPLLRNKYFLSLMQTPPNNLTQDACKPYLRDFGVDDTPNEICVSIIVPNYGSSLVNDQMSMQAVLEEELTTALKAAEIGCVVVYDSIQRVLLVAYSKAQFLTFALEQKISIIRDKLRYIHQIDFHASIGNAVSGFHLLQESYHNAEHALSYCTILGSNNIISSDNIKNVDLLSPQAPSMHYSKIMELLVSGNLQKMHDAVSAHFNELYYSYRLSIHALQCRAVELLALLLACAREMGENVDAILEKGPTVYASILSSTNIQSIIKVFYSTTKSIFENIQGHRDAEKNRALRGAKQYILQNYSDPELNLTRVAAHVNLSPSYVSQLFKRLDNCSFTEYLNSVRIEQAKVLLATMHMRVYEVSDAVGYQNSKYFFQLFKQLTGMRPREFYTSSSAGDSI